MKETSVLIQIYEIQTPRAAETVVNLGVDHVGSVILDEQRWKIPELKDTIRLVSESGAKSSLIPLFSSADAVSRALDYYQPDILHCCEMISTLAESGEYLEMILACQSKVRERFPEIGVMRSLPVGPPGAGQKASLFEIVSLFEPVSDYFLTDTVLSDPGDTAPDNQPVPGFVGITGTICDWDLVSDLVEFTSIPVILAGGISPDNVYEAIAATRPTGVDSCPRTNREDGRGGTVRFEKDYEKVKKFVSEVRRAEAEGLCR